LFSSPRQPAELETVPWLVQCKTFSMRNWQKLPGTLKAQNLLGSPDLLKLKLRFSSCLHSVTQMPLPSNLPTRAITAIGSHSYEQLLQLILRKDSPQARITRGEGLYLKQGVAKTLNANRMRLTHPCLVSEPAPCLLTCLKSFRFRGSAACPPSHLI
jgi:hypothetical protein